MTTPEPERIVQRRQSSAIPQAMLDECREVVARHLGWEQFRAVRMLITENAVQVSAQRRWPTEWDHRTDAE